MFKQLSGVMQSIAGLSEYLSPYKLSGGLLPPLVIYNRSGHAVNAAIRQLKNAFPEMPIIQVVAEGKKPHALADHVIFVPNKPASFKNAQLVKDKYDELARTIPRLNVEKRDPLLYCIWSAEAESATLAEQTQEVGMKWVGTSPEPLKILGEKILYKEYCREHGVDTADFFTLKTATDENVPDDGFDEYVDTLTDEFMENLKGAREEGRLQGSLFLKSSYGGGGRGTVKVKDPSNRAEVRAAMVKVITDTHAGDAIYAEAALDLQDCSIFQLELEVDGTEVEPGGRLVWFNPANQKVLEIGLSDALMEGIISAELYQKCVQDTKKLAEAAKYDSKGTHEYLLTRNNTTNEWGAFGSEWNGRIQVEHQALSYGQVDAEGHNKNIPAEQLLRSLGVPAPKKGEHFKPQDGRDIVLHVRLVNAEPKMGEKWGYNGGRIVDYANLPEGAEIYINDGKIDTASDPQVGRLLLYAKTWDEMLEQLSQVGDMTIIGENGPMCGGYLAFLKQLAGMEAFRNVGHLDEGIEADAPILGCNMTSNALDAPRSPLTPHALKVRQLSMHTQLTGNGYKPETLETQYPDEGILEDYDALIEEIERLETEAEVAGEVLAADRTPLEHFFKTEGSAEDRLNAHYKAFMAQLDKQGGGLGNSVFPRDTFQEGVQSQSSLIQDLYMRLMNLHGAKVFSGSESGGAAYNKASMDGLGGSQMFMSGFSLKVPNRTLVRSEWMNSLDSKTPEEQDSIIKTQVALIRDELGLKKDDYIPFWAPNNFHAGNVAKQDETTGLFLKHKVIVVPNFTWDPRFEANHIKEWTRRQVQLFRDHGLPIRELRIKNPGQQPGWTAEEIQRCVNLMLDTCEEMGIAPEDFPAIHIHNHNVSAYGEGVDGQLQDPAKIAVDTLKAMQSGNSGRAYRRLCFDAAPPGTTHNNSETVAEALELSTEQKEALAAFNKGCLTLFEAVGRFDIRDHLRALVNQESVWALGTGTSDLSSAIALGLEQKYIEPAKKLAFDVFGLGAVVTPYSEHLKRIGYIIHLHPHFKKILETKEFLEPSDVTDYINSPEYHKGRLNLPADTLQILAKWDTLLDQPEATVTLLQKHGIPVHTLNQEAMKKAGLEAVKQEFSQLIAFKDKKFIDILIQNGRITFMDICSVYNIGPNEIDTLVLSMMMGVEAFEAALATYTPIVLAGKAVEEKRKLDLETLRTELKRKYPNVEITDTILHDVIANGSIARQYLSSLNENQDLSLYFRQTKLLIQNPKKLREVGNEFLLPTEVDGKTTWEKVKVIGTNEDSEEYQKKAVLKMKYRLANGDQIETSALDRKKAIELGIIVPPTIVKPQDERTQVPAPAEGRVAKWTVEPGHVITEANCVSENGEPPLEPLGTLEITKTEGPLMLDRKYIGKTIDSFEVPENAAIDSRRQLLIKVRD